MPISKPVIIGPPARPNLIGVLMPGMKIGIEPRIKPRTMPINIAPKFGSLNDPLALSSSFSTIAIDLDSPTTVRRSPNCKTNPGVANRTIPFRVIRVTDIPK